VRNSPLTTLLSYTLTVVLILHFGYKVMSRIQTNRQQASFNTAPLFLQTVPPKPIIKKPELIPGGIVIKADTQGHFTGTAFINNVAVPFLIDTGATETVVPVALANQALLPIGQVGQSDTAGGLTHDVSTRINSLKIGNAEIKNISARVNFSIDEVLIGMNTLKYFNMFVKNNTMTLVAANNPEEINIIASDLEVGRNQAAPPPQLTSQPKKAVKSWKKTVVCNSDGTECKTSYGAK